MFPFQKNVNEEYQKNMNELNQKKKFEFPLGKFKFTIIDIEPNKPSRFDEDVKQCEMTLLVHLDHTDMKSKDWFGYRDQDMWKWATLAKSLGISKPNITDLNKNDLLDAQGVLECKEVLSKKTGHMERKRYYIAKDNEILFENKSKEDLLDIPF